MCQCTHKCVQTCTHLLSERTHRARSSQQINKCARISREVTMATVSPSLLSLSLPHCFPDRGAWLAGCPGGKTIAGFKSNVTSSAAFTLPSLPFSNQGKTAEQRAYCIDDAVSQVAQQPMHGSAGETLKKHVFGEISSVLPHIPPPCLHLFLVLYNVNNCLLPFVGHKRKRDFTQAN